MNIIPQEDQSCARAEHPLFLVSHLCSLDSQSELSSEPSSEDSPIKCGRRSALEAVARGGGNKERARKVLAVRVSAAQSKRPEV